MRGPTLFTTTIVLLFCAATASTMLSPLCQAVRLLLDENENHVFFKSKERTDHLGCHRQ